MKKHTILYSALTALLLASGASFTANAGGAPPPTFGDFVWNDLNGDGLQDIGESGIADVVVNVCGSQGGTPPTIDCSGFLIDSATTDSLGNYSLTLTFGSGTGYFAWVDLATVPGGFTPTTPTQLYYPSSVVEVSTADFGFQAVPVPAAVWLFGSGLLGLIGVVRRNRRS